MKTTVKFMLIITLFCSTSSIAFADGEQGTGARCTVDCPAEPAPTPPTSSGNSVGADAESATTTLNTTNVENTDLSSNTGDLSLIDWLFGFFW